MIAPLAYSYFVTCLVIVESATSMSCLLIAYYSAYVLFRSPLSANDFARIVHDVPIQTDSEASSSSPGSSAVSASRLLSALELDAVFDTLRLEEGPGRGDLLVG